MLTSSKQENEMRTTGFRKGCKHTGKQRLPWDNLVFAFARMEQRGLVAQWSNQLGIQRWLSVASDALFRTEWPWTGWPQTQFLDLSDRQISPLKGSMFISGNVAKVMKDIITTKASKAVVYE